MWFRISSIVNIALANVNNKVGKDHCKIKKCEMMLTAEEIQVKLLGDSHGRKNSGS